MRFLIALGAIVAVAVATAGSAAASVRLGSDFPGSPGVGSANGTVVQDETDTAAPYSYVTPSAGVITSWTTRSGTSGGTAGLRVYRPTGTASEWFVIGRSATETIVSDTLQTFPTRIVVPAGAHLGLRSDGPLESYTTGDGDDKRSVFGSDPADNTTATTSVGTFTGRRVNVAVTLEPDADGDTFGDETQDQCPSAINTQGPCPDLEAVLTATPTTTTRSGKVSFSLTAHNTSTTAGATGVTAHLSLAPDLVLDLRSVPAGCTSGNADGRDFVDCRLPDVGAGVSTGMQVDALTTKVGTTSATGTVGYGAVDPNAANNSASVSAGVVYDSVRHCPAPNFFGGTLANDRIRGTRFSDPIYAGKGNDVLFGLAGNDCIFAGPGNDSVSGGQGNDLIKGETGLDLLRGGGGRDRIFGGASSDRLYGDAGNDRMDGGLAVDRFYGGAGNDIIQAADRKNEKVDCGPGRHDKVTADRGDKLRGCEHVRIKR